MFARHRTGRSGAGQRHVGPGVGKGRELAQNSVRGEAPAVDDTMSLTPKADQDTLFRVTGTGPYKATGESDLGALKGGTYRYEATITPEKFDATYKSEDDHGIFSLERPKPKS